MEQDSQEVMNGKTAPLESEKEKDENKQGAGKKKVEEKYVSATIPVAVFVEDVEEFMSQPGNNDAEKIIRALDEQHNKYKFMEFSLMSKKKRMKTQIPDLERSLSTVSDLKEIFQKSNDDVICDYLVSEQVYSKAKIHHTKTVYLWLGANVMLEYPMDDASALLEKNIDNAKKNVTFLDQELGFLREQRTTVEVNMARIFNWDVKRRQKQKKDTAKS